MGKTFERSRFSPVPTNRGKAGRPSLCTPEVTEKILKNLAAGSYVVTACEAAGVAYASVRIWIARAQREREEGKTKTPYIEFADRLAHAERAAEQALVTRLNIAEDWRAQSFILERRWRDRWGKTDAPVAPTQVLVIAAESAPGILEALRVARGETIEATATVEESGGELVQLPAPERD